MNGWGMERLKYIALMILMGFTMVLAAGIMLSTAGCDEINCCSTDCGIEWKVDHIGYCPIQEAPEPNPLPDAGMPDADAGAPDVTCNGNGHFKKEHKNKGEGHCEYL